MTLPARQQHALDAIDDVLQSAEPRLATMFGVFTDLTRLEAMPATETLAPGPWWTRHRLPGQRYRPGRHHQYRRRAGRRLRRMVLVPVLLLAAVTLVVVSLVGAGPGGRRACGQAVMTIMGPRMRATSTGAAGTGGTGKDAAGTTAATGTAAGGAAAGGTGTLAGTGCRSASAQPAGGSG